MNKKNQKSEEFKVLLKFMDWSSRKFSNIYLNENSSYDLDESEYKKHHNKVKGQLKRASNTEKATANLITYINFIKDYDEFNIKNKAHSFETVEFIDSILHISGVTYGPVCHQRNPNYKVKLQFRAVDRFVGTVDLELINKQEIGYECAS